MWSSNGSYSISPEFLAPERKSERSSALRLEQCSAFSTVLQSRERDVVSCRQRTLRATTRRTAAVRDALPRGLERARRLGLGRRRRPRTRSSNRGGGSRSATSRVRRPVGGPSLAPARARASAGARPRCLRDGGERDRPAVLVRSASRRRPTARREASDACSSRGVGREAADCGDHARSPVSLPGQRRPPRAAPIERDDRGERARGATTPSRRSCPPGAGR